MEVLAELVLEPRGMSKTSEGDEVLVVLKLSPGGGAGYEVGNEVRLGKSVSFVCFELMDFVSFESFERDRFDCK